MDGGGEWRESQNKNGKLTSPENNSISCTCTDARGLFPPNSSMEKFYTIYHTHMHTHTHTHMHINTHPPTHTHMHNESSSPSPQRWGLAKAEPDFSLALFTCTKILTVHTNFHLQKSVSGEFPPLPSRT